MGRVRIEVGRRIREACVAFALCAIATIPATPAAADVITLPYYNIDGYHTSLRLVNPTGAPVAVPHFWDPIGTGAGTVVVGPFETKAAGDWPHAGGEMADVDVPVPLLAYVQIVDNLGSILRILPISAATRPVQLQDILVGADQRAYVWVKNADAGTIEWYRDDVRLSSEGIHGDLVIRPAPFGCNRAVVSPSFFDASPHFYVFAYHRRQSGRYELQSTVYATEVPHE